MKNLNLLEEQLRKWRPRRPSIRLEEQLFGRAHRDTDRPIPHDAWSWVAPLTAAWLSFILLMSLEISPDRQIGHELSALSSESMPAQGMDQSIGEAGLRKAPAPGIRRNTWPKGIFEWTSSRPILSDRGSFLLLNTNRLRP